MRRSILSWILLYFLILPSHADPFPVSSDPLDDTLEFMRRHLVGSTLEPGVLDRLRQLKSSGKFINRPLDNSNLALWLEAQEAIWLNSNVLRLWDNYAEKALNCRTQRERASSPDQVQRLERQEGVLWRLHQERILELSAALAHEGTHAYLGNSDDAKADETAAYMVEAEWLRNLWDKLPEHRAKIREMENSLQESYPGCTDAPIPRTLPLP